MGDSYDTADSYRSTRLSDLQHSKTQGDYEGERSGDSYPSVCVDGGAWFDWIIISEQLFYGSTDTGHEQHLVSRQLGIITEVLWIYSGSELLSHSLGYSASQSASL